MNELAPPSSARAPLVVNAWLDGDQIVSLQRLPDGTTRERSVRAEWVSYHAAADVAADKLRALRNHAAVRSVIEERGWLRVAWRDRNVREKACKSTNADGIENPFFGASPAYEGDVHPIRRWMTDVEARVARPSRAYFDLETDSRVPFQKAREGGARVLSWAIVDDEGGEWSEVLDADTDAAERELLRKFFDVATRFELLLAWNGDNFDFPVLAGRVDRLRVRADVRRWLWLDHLACFKRNHRDADSGDDKTSMKLQDVAMAIVGEGKDDFDTSKTWEEWSAGGERRERLRLYNVQDTKLLPKIEAKTGYVELSWTLAEAAGVFPDSRGLHPITQVDAFMFRMGREHNVHFPTKQFVETTEQFAGAYVLKPTRKGIVREVHVIDFRRQYPSAIISWNMSPETKLRTLRANHSDPASACEAPTTKVAFRTDVEGMLPAALKKLIALRAQWDQKKKECPPGTPAWEDAGRRAAAYKAAINSFYGVIGSPFSRYFDREIAESVTQTCAWLIKATQHEAERRGWSVIYIDTDSIFVVGCSTDEFRAFAKWCNEELYPRLAREQGCRENDIWVEYEKAFDRVVFGSAKKYCNPPEAPILMSDFSTKALGDVRIGDSVLGWVDGTTEKRRHFEVAEVVAVHRHRAPIVKLTMQSGMTIRCTLDHQWLRSRAVDIRRGSKRYQYPWCTPRVGRKLLPIVHQSRTLSLEEQREASWLGGIFDGEGSLSGKARNQIVISQSRVKNPEVCARIERALSMLGLKFSVWSPAAQPEMNVYAIGGGKQGRYDFLSWCAPAKGHRIVASMMRSFFARAGDPIVAVAPDGEGEVIGLTTTTGNYIAWGYASKNCGKYLHYKGKAATRDSKPEIKGLEFKRGDSSKLARALQERVVKLIVGEWAEPYAPPTEDVGAYEAAIVEARTHVLEGPLTTKEIVISKSLSCELGEYKVKKKADQTDAAGPRHVAVARELQKRGAEIGAGSKIGFVVIDASSTPAVVIPADDFDGTCDRHYLWEKLVWPPTERLLEAAFPGGEWKAKFGRTRPAKPRASKARSGDGKGASAASGAADGPPAQAGLFDAPSAAPRRATKKRFLVADAPAVPAAPAADPFWIEVDETTFTSGVAIEARELLAAHPGARPAMLRLALATGERVEMDLKMRVSGSIEMAHALGAILVARHRGGPEVTTHGPSGTHANDEARRFYQRGPDHAFA